MLIIGLVIFGIIAIITGIISGFVYGTFWVFVFFSIIGFSIAMVFFALSSILHNQETIVYHLQQQDQFLKKINKKLKKCPNCDSEYDDELNSCPHCGHRQPR